MNIDEDPVVEEVLDNNEAIESPDVSEENVSEDEPANIQEDDEDDEEDRVVTIGDSEPEAESEESEEHQETPGWVKKVRKSNRKLTSENKRKDREIQQLKEQIQGTTEKSKPVELGEKPTLANCKYDDKKYETELISYYERKRKVDEQAAQKAKAVEAQNKSWQSRQEKYVNLKQEHSFKDFEDAEELVSTTFSQTQQGIIVQGAEDAALLVYALGKNPKKLEELSKITDPVDFAFKVAKLESQLKVIDRKAPKPEKRVSSNKSGGISGNTDKTLERLREEGDFNKIVAYKKKHGIK